MAMIIGVRFRTAGKIYYFDPAERTIKIGDHVIVETARGVEYGHVVLGNREVDDAKVVSPLKPVIRMATEEDDAIEARNRQKEKEAFKICQEKIRRHNLEMKLIDAEYTFDNNKVLFYFTADGRIDFRELVKDLASVFRTRIELRQVGVRDETKIMGGYGICGRPLCCHSYLSDFAPVSIRMAKEQNLSLNPSKISGVCGRLMCCLKNEEETYEYLNSRLPGNGDFVITADGMKGEVQGVNVLRQLVKVLVTVGRDEKELREYKVEELKFKPRKRKGKGAAAPAAGEEMTEEELRMLEEMEQEDAESRSSAGAARGGRGRRGGEGRPRSERAGENRGRSRGEHGEAAGRPERAGAADGADAVRSEESGRPDASEAGRTGQTRRGRRDGAGSRERRLKGENRPHGERGLAAAFGEAEGQESQGRPGRGRRDRRSRGPREGQEQP